jgi:phosphatidylserine decarboxylase
MPKLPVAREGWPYVAVPAALAGTLFLLGRRFGALPFALAAAASLGFFRDPERDVPVLPSAVLAPADGRVTDVGDAVDSFVGPAVRVSIFLSPFDVHINRAPIAGRVVEAIYRPGRFVAAYRPEAEANESCSVHIQGERSRVTVTQIAGAVARRIVCRVGSGDVLAAGARIGMIKFGSRTDCYMPRGTEVRVRPGERVVGAETVIGVLA